MASGQQWINTTRLCGYMGVYDHAMPIVVADGGVPLGIEITLVFAQGRSVPISRGSPPISG